MKESRALHFSSDNMSGQKKGRNVGFFFLFFPSAWSFRGGSRETSKGVFTGESMAFVRGKGD